MQFNAKITLNSAIPGEDFTVWTIAFSVSSVDGGYTGLDVAIGDLLLIDTASILPGSITRYTVSAINSQDAFGAEVEINLTDPAMELYLPDLGWSVGIDHVICDPTPRRKYAILPDAELNLLSAKFETYIRNIEFLEKIDELDPLPDQTGNDGKFLTTDGTTASWASVSASVSGYIHTQVSPADSWSIVHPGDTVNAIVSIYDADNNLILPDNVNILNNDQIDVTFSVAMSGRAVVMLF